MEKSKKNSIFSFVADLENYNRGEPEGLWLCCAPVECVRNFFDYLRRKIEVDSSNTKLMMSWKGHQILSKEECKWDHYGFIDGWHHTSFWKTKQWCPWTFSICGMKQFDHLTLVSIDYWRFVVSNYCRDTQLRRLTIPIVIEKIIVIYLNVKSAHFEKVSGCRDLSNDSD